MTLTPDQRTRMDRDYHDTIGDEYDRVILQPRQTASDILFGKLTPHLPSGGHMLDVGCGTGQAVCRFGPRVERVTAVDHSRGMLEEARRNVRQAGVGQVEFIETDVLEWLDTERQARFDLITAIGFLHHLTDDQVMRVVERMSGLLAAGGRILLADPVDVGDRRPPSLIERWNRRSLAATATYEHEPPEPDERPLPLPLMERAFSGARLRVIAESGSWEIFNRSVHPGLAERLMIRVLYHYGGRGVVRAWLLGAA